MNRPGMFVEEVAQERFQFLLGKKLLSDRAGGILFRPLAAAVRNDDFVFDVERQQDAEIVRQVIRLFGQPFPAGALFFIRR